MKTWFFVLILERHRSTQGSNIYTSNCLSTCRVRFANIYKKEDINYIEFLSLRDSIGHFGRVVIV